MQTDYRAFIDRMISRYEGGYGWDRGDPGGPTKYGITCYDLAEFMHKPMNSMSTWAPIVRAMPLSTAETIYDTKYATRARFNDLAPGCDTEVADFLVNSGLRSLWTAQSIVGEPKSNSLSDAAVAKINANPLRFIAAMSDRRLAFLKALGTWHIFGVGWARRVADLRAYSISLANQVAPQPAPDIHNEIKLVKEAQAALNSILGLAMPVDGDPGPLTRAAVTTFQKRYGLTADGLLGPITYAKLDEVMQQTSAPAAVAALPDSDNVMAKGVSDVHFFDQEAA